MSLLSPTPRVALLALLLASCARAQSPSADEGRRVVDELVASYEPATPAEIRTYESAARRGCDGGQDMAGYEYVACQGVRLALAETELAAAARRREAGIRAASQDYPLAEGRQAYAERWLAIWAHAQRQWRELRDAECASEIFEYVGGSGANAGYDQCRADRTFERAVQVHAM